MIGKRIGKYRVVRALGEGGMGVVYEAVREDIEVRAAIKVLRPEFASNTEVAGRFFNEARAANMIAHPGIVKVFDYGNEPGGIAYLAMEYLDGESLWKRMERVGKMPKADMLRIGRQIASALAAAHEKGIVHRDLKPENIYLVPDVETPGGERIKLLDFGIAKIISDSAVGVRTQANVLMGTPAYMSPEQCLGAKDVDAKTDVYALGTILFELLAARTPFVAERPGEFLTMHMLKPPPLLTQFVPLLPSKLVGLVHAMLAKEPAARPTMEQVAAQLQRLIAGQGQGAGPPGPELLPLQPIEPRPDEERPTRPAKALGGRRASGEISGSELPVTAALRVKKLAPKSAGNAAQTDVTDSEAYDPTNPGAPDFGTKLDDIMENARTVPVQAMHRQDLAQAIAARIAAEPAPAGAAPLPTPPSNPTGQSWVPMEIVKTDYKSTPHMPAGGVSELFVKPEKSRQSLGSGNKVQSGAVAVPARSRLMLWLVVMAALLLLAVTALLLLRSQGG